jgi:hypothetical protein
MAAHHAREMITYFYVYYAYDKDDQLLLHRHDRA